VLSSETTNGGNMAINTIGQFVRSWERSIHDGYLKESMTPEAYCQMKWEAEKTHTVSKEKFMIDCQYWVWSYREYARWCRKN